MCGTLHALNYSELQTSATNKNSCVKIIEENIYGKYGFIFMQVSW